MVIIEQAKTKERNHKLKRSQSAKRDVQPTGEGQFSKKQEYNAKEKIRRMNLNATYLALGALPPDLRRTKGEIHEGNSSGQLCGHSCRNGSNGGLFSFLQSTD
ncbi:hypothetical protein LWI29_003423 [Acer saccharum]|uniref:BHLH domain-containing protein n=1 Tax=Acer saccharum TaxID=4024 RepID=A0AA39T2A4_ACESA|nr:hypothetical protein LWI29_003423 [Acer saccharum]